MKELGFNLINKNLIGARTFLGIFHDFAPPGGCICIKKEKHFEIKALFSFLLPPENFLNGRVGIRN